MKALIMAVAVFAVFTLGGCSSPADVASHNLSKMADEFKINRRIVFYNGITGSYMLTITGRCSLGNQDPSGELSVTCKTGPNEFKKHFLGLSDNVTYFAEQLQSAEAGIYHYKVIFNPSTIVPDVDMAK